MIYLCDFPTNYEDEELINYIMERLTPIEQKVFQIFLCFPVDYTEKTNYDKIHLRGVSRYMGLEYKKVKEIRQKIYMIIKQYINE